MSSENPQSDTSGGRETDIREVIKQDRLQDLRSARDSVRNARRTSRELVAEGVPETAATALYLDEFQQLLLELKPYADLDETTRKFWHGFEGSRLADWEIDPPPRGGDAWEQVGRAGSGRSYSSLEPHTVTEINGLLDFIRMPTSYSHTFEYVTKPRNSPLMRYQAVVTETVPRPTVDMGVDLANRFQDYIGLDVDLARESKDYNLEYQDLLE